MLRSVMTLTSPKSSLKASLSGVMTLPAPFLVGVFVAPVAIVHLARLVCG